MNQNDNFIDCLVDYIAVYPNCNHDFLYNWISNYNIFTVRNIISKIMDKKTILYLYTIDNAKITEFDNILYSKTSNIQIETKVPIANTYTHFHNTSIYPPNTFPQHNTYTHQHPQHNTYTHQHNAYYTHQHNSYVPPQNNAYVPPHRRH